MYPTEDVSKYILGDLDSVHFNLDYPIIQITRIPGYKVGH